MRVSITQIALSVAFSAALGGIFAVSSNLISGANLIGISLASALTIGGIFGAAGALLIKLASAISGRSSRIFYLASGIAFGAAIYLLNVYFGFNAGFSLFGLTLISGFGLMSGIGCIASHSLVSRLRRLHRLT